jgi:translation elongation factor EF-G
MKIRAENNKELLAKINELQNRINSFQEILNKLNLLFSNSDLLSKELKKVADFAETKKEIWFTEYTLESNGSLKLQGLSGNRFNPSELTSSYEGGTLRNALVENLSGSIYYKFQIDAVLNPIY